MIHDAIHDAARFSEKKLAVLVDPDRQHPSALGQTGRRVAEAGADLLLVGGSLLSSDQLHESLLALREACSLPLVLFPGRAWQVSDAADAILFLSLVSGRNPELLIGQQVHAAPLLSRTALEVIPTAYLLVDGGSVTSAAYISQTLPIPADKPDIAVATALAASYLGMRMVYLDTGSGAAEPARPAMVQAVKQATRLPLFVGGGIRTAAQATQVARAGADVVVVGTAFERDPDLLGDLCQAVHAATHIASR
jgi:phosphoglycerol geranylgeranyltransferase